MKRIDLNYFKKISVEETLKTLKVDLDNGLTNEEVSLRLQKYGPNETPEKEESTFMRVFRRFWGPIPWMIEVAALLSALVKKWEDFVIIITLLLVNAILDFWQESKALNALKVLKEGLAKKATVLRSGQFQNIEARELVPGDIIKIRLGEIIPADIKLCSGEYLQVDQSALTGESLPVSKKSGDIAYSNSIARQGEMLAVVIATGQNTYFGKTVALVAKAGKEERSHFQKMVIKIGNYLILITAVMVAMILLSAIYRHENLIIVLRFALVLTVAAIPIALPAVLTVTMAVGAMNLAKKKAIVSRLAAIEELAGMDILCADKTGTLTKNEMTIATPVTFRNYSVEKLMIYAGLASKEENKDPIEIPIFEYLKNNNLYDKLKDYHRQAFKPFDPIRKRTEATITSGNEKIIVIKGAPQVILKLCGDVSDGQVKKPVHKLANKGYRTLGVAIKSEQEENFHYVGLVPFYDPPRDDAEATIYEAHDLGLEIKMLTGDNIAIAKQISMTLGLKTNILESDALAEDAREEFKEYRILAEVIGKSLYKKLDEQISEDEAEEFAKQIAKQVKAELKNQILPHGHIKSHESEIIELIENASGFAQVFPEEKYLIVDKLQKADHIVGMTGDGVNDAPALKKADAGIAVSGATDAARAAADLILTAPGISVIVKAIEQARVIFERMQSYAIYRISETIRVIIFMTLSILFFNFYPVTAIMIIILALLNDIPILTIAYDNTKINEEPVRWNNRELFGLSTLLGINGVISSFLLFFLLEKYSGLSQPLIQSIIFTKLVVAGHGSIYNTRTTDWFFKRPYPAWALFNATISTGIAGTLIAIYGIFIPAIGWGWAAVVWGYALLWFVLNDVLKVFAYHNLFKENKLSWLFRFSG